MLGQAVKKLARTEEANPLSLCILELEAMLCGASNAV
jgi:hypothetical protein